MIRTIIIIIVITAPMALPLPLPFLPLLELGIVMISNELSPQDLCQSLTVSVPIVYLYYIPMIRFCNE